MSHVTKYQMATEYVQVRVPERCLETKNDGADVTHDGNSFHWLAPKTGNARLPTAVRQKGSHSKTEEADLSLCRLGTSLSVTGEVRRHITWCTAVKGSVSLERTVILNRIRSAARSKNKYECTMDQELARCCVCAGQTLRLRYKTAALFWVK